MIVFVRSPAIVKYSPMIKKTGKKNAHLHFQRTAASRPRDLCYAQMGWVDSYLNQPSVKAELGVSPEREFTTCNMDVNQAFTMNGDWSNSALLLPELVDRFPFVARNTDIIRVNVGIFCSAR
jgi:Serine carboxypeptidase